jgi:hypothetical protein
VLPGWEAMSTQTDFLVRSARVFPILLSAICLVSICLVSTADGQHGGGGSGHGGGGGHSGAGHSGGGHSSAAHSSRGHSGGSHAGRHFSWLHFGFWKHSGPKAGSGGFSSSDTSTALPSRLRSFNRAVRSAHISRMPTTLLWSPPLVRSGLDRRVSFASSGWRRHRRFFQRFPQFASSGCFFNSVSQVCFFEPLWPLLCFYGDFGYFDFGFGGLDFGGDQQGLTESQMPGMWQAGNLSEMNPPDANSSDETGTAKGNLPMRLGAGLSAPPEDWQLGKGVFVLVLNNGARIAVTDYWAADSYLEFVSPDGTRGHVPLEALDLENTVERNGVRGLPFVLRSTAATNR